MRRSWFVPSLGIAALTLLGVGLWSSCFAPTYSDCAFRCGSGEPRCPDEYVCQSDGYCHLPDSTAVCGPAQGIDLATSLDLATPADLLSPDVDADPVD